MLCAHTLPSDEGALFTAVRILGHAVVKLGGSESELLAKFKEARNDANADGRTNETATLDMLIRLLFEEPRAYVPTDPNSN
jgi:hypothetical protein